MIGQWGAENFSVFSRQQNGFTVTDAGPGLEYNFLFFNLNDLGEKASADLQRKQKWFRDVKFRQAVSAAADREAIFRLVSQGRGAAIWRLVTPSDNPWADPHLLHHPPSLERARHLLQ